MVLLCEPTSKSLIVIIYKPTVWLNECLRIWKTQKELAQFHEDSINIWKKNWFDKYEKRRATLMDITLAQFFAKYNENAKRVYRERAEKCNTHWRHYDMALNLEEYKRKVVTLFSKKFSLFSKWSRFHFKMKKLKFWLIKITCRFVMIMKM